MLLAASLRDAPAWQSGEIPGTAGSLIWDGDEPVAGLTVTTETVLLHGEPVCAMPVLAGGVRPGASYEAMLACRTELAALWREGEAAVSFKWGFSKDFYGDLFGYQPVMLGWEALCHFPDSVGAAVPAGVREARWEDLPALADLYARRSRDHSGTVVRSLATWQEGCWPYFTTGESRTLLVHEGPEGIDGYLALRRGADGPVQVLRVMEWLDASPDAWRSLGQALRAMAGAEVLPVLLPPLPADRPWEAYWPETTDLRPIRSLLFRPGAPEHFLPTVVCRPSEGEVSLSVADPFQLWPRQIRLRWAGGRVTDWEPVERAEVHVDVGTLGLVALGLLDPYHAQRLRRLDGEALAVERLAAAFAPAPLYRYPADFRLHKRQIGH
jgi:hypothetical protein